MATRKASKATSCENAFVLNGQKLNVTAARAEYTRMLKRFTELAVAQRAAATETIDKFKDDVDSFCSDADEWAHQYIDTAADLAVEELVAKGCLDVDRDAFLEDYLNSSLWDNRIKELRLLARKLQEEEEEREARRQDRTESARHFFDDDYDDEKMMNLASAGVSGVFNMIGRGMASSEMSEKIKAKFDEDRNAYLRAIYMTIRTSVDECVSCLNDKGKGFGDGGVAREDREKADRLFNNLSRSKMPKKVAEETMLEILRLDPYKQEFYEWCFMENGDSSGELEKIAEYFGVSLAAVKAEKFAKELGECPYETEDETIAYRRKAVRLGEEIRIDPVEKLKEIDAKLKEFDEKARTVDDKMFDTREEAALQRQLSEFEKHIDLSTEEAAIASRKSLADKAKELGVDGEWKMKRVDNAIKKFDEMARTTFGVLFESREAAKAALGDRELFYKGIEATVKALGQDAFYTATTMPEKKIANARAAFPIPMDEFVVALTDTTLFGSGKTGLAVTKWGLRWTNGSKVTNLKAISWEDFANVQNEPTHSDNSFTLCDGALYANGYSNVEEGKMAEFLVAIYGYCRVATFFAKKSAEEIAAEEAEMPFLGRVEKILWSMTDSGFLTGTRIPDKKRVNATKSCMVDADDRILGLIDSTLFGTAATALVVCEKGVYWHNKETTCKCFIPWNKISSYNDTMSVTQDGRLLFSQGNGFKLGLTASVDLNRLKDVLLRIGDLAVKD